MLAVSLMQHTTKICLNLVTMVPYTPRVCDYLLVLSTVNTTLSQDRRVDIERKNLINTLSVFY